MLSAGSVEVEQEGRVGARSGEGGERDAFGGPAVWILVWSVHGRKELGEECAYCLRSF